MRLVAAALAFGLVAAPLAARADGMGCLIGPTDTNPCSLGGVPAAALAAIAVPVLVAGASVSIAHELRRRTEERAPAAPANPRHAPPTLALVPEPPDPYRAPAGAAEKRTRPSPAFEFNEKATNVATVVAGAAVVGAAIATIVHGAAHK